jgi:ATP-dependent DNA helicase RecG
MRESKFKESETLELKKSTSELKEGLVSIVSILNKHQSGKLYFGIKNDGAVEGQNVNEKTIRDVSKSISDNIEPKIFPEITEEKLERKSCILVKFEGSEIPYFAYGRAYIRVGDEDKQLSAKELENLFLKKKKVSWEEGASEKTIRDVNEDAVKNFVTKANKLNLIKEDKLLRAVDVLFCDNNFLEVQAAVFAGMDKLTFLDIKQFKGNIFNLLEQSESYIKEHMNWRAKLVGREREEIPEVPVRAITEAIVNSLGHRDYNNPKGNEIAVFKDRIEIYNPGQFPEEYSPLDFIKGEERSILRNPIIAHTLYLSKEIERWGSGIRRIYEECEKENVKVEFKKLKSGFVVVFSRMERVGEKVGEKLTENQKKIIDFIQKEPTISAKELSKLLGISQRKIEDNLSKLKDKGLLRRIGADRGGYWKVAGG